MATIAMDSSSSSSLYPPPEVPKKLHLENREKLLKHLRESLDASSRPLRGFVLLQGGQEQTRYCTDHEDLFRQESYFAYLFGVREPGFYGAIDVDTGKSILFAPRLPAEYAVWMGEIKTLAYFKETYMVSMVHYTDEITEVLNNQYQGSGKPLLFLLHGLNTDSKNFSKPAEFERGADFWLVTHEPRISTETTSLPFWVGVRLHTSYLHQSPDPFWDTGWVLFGLVCLAEDHGLLRSQFP